MTPFMELLFMILTSPLAYCLYALAVANLAVNKLPH